MLNTVRVTAVVHVTSVEWKSNAYTLLVVKEGPDRGINLEDPDVDGIVTFSGSCRMGC